MKKRILSVLIILAVLLTCALSLCACDDDKGKGDVTVVIACDGSNKEYYVGKDEVEKDGVIAVFDYLKKEKGLHLVYNESTYGVFVTEVGDFKEGDGKYVYFYTSVVKDQDVSSYKQTLEYKGKTLVSAGVGLSQMTVEENAVIYVGYIEY